MRIFRGHRPHPAADPGCALTIGNFDGVHRGHQAMLALLNSEARHRRLRSCVMTFEPHPRDWFASQAGKPELAPLRIATLRDKLQELERCGVDEVVLMRFDERFASQTPDEFIREVLLGQLRARYVLVGDDFRFGAKRAGDYPLLDAAGNDLGFDVARMMSYEVRGLRVSSSEVRAALAAGDMARAARFLGRPYAITGHVVHGRKLGRDLGFRTLNLRFPSHRPAAQGIFVVQVHGLGSKPLPGVASLGVRPSVEDAGRVLLEVHCLEWPQHLDVNAGYAQLLQIDLMHKLHDERRYPSLDALRAGIAQDVQDALAWWQNRPNLPAR